MASGERCKKYDIETRILHVRARLWIHRIIASAQSDCGGEINITLSAKAAARLAADKESIIPLARHSGEPKMNSEAAANKVNTIGPDGRVNLTPRQESVEIPGIGGPASHQWQI